MTAESIMTVILAPLWEVWNWSDSDVTFFAVVLLLFGAFGAGFGAGYRAALGEDREPPGWVYVAVIAGMIGLLMLVVLYSDCAGECEPSDW